MTSIGWQHTAQSSTYFCVDPPRVPSAARSPRAGRGLLTVFVPFVMLYMKQPFKLNYLWAALCIMAAVYFVFRS